MPRSRRLTPWGWMSSSPTIMLPGRIFRRLSPSSTQPGRTAFTPNPDLCGTGVAFKLCQGLANAMGIGEEELHPFLDLVGLATVADLVPLRRENRVLARYGLKALGRTRNLGLQALMAEAGVSPDGVSAGKVGFGLAPRLNALGRLGEAQDGLRLLLTDDSGRRSAVGPGGRVGEPGTAGC